MPRIAPLLLSLTLLALGAVSARGADLPEALLSKPQLNEADAKIVHDFADPLAARLGSEEAQATTQAREDLLAPLRGSVSVAFRLAYSEALASPLAKLAAGQDERVAVNALRVAGTLATQACTDILRKALVDPRPAVRYAGAFGSRRTLEEVAQGRSPLDAAQVQGLVTGLATHLKRENEPAAAGGFIRAFNAVGPDPAVRASALTAMCGAVDDQAATFARAERKGDPAAWAEAYLLGVEVAQSALVEQLKVGVVNDALAKAAAQMCGRALAHVVTRLESFKSSEDHSAELAALTGLGSAAEGTLVFIDANISKHAARPQTIKDAFPDAAKVRVEAAKWIGPQGALTNAPYSFKPFIP